MSVVHCDSYGEAHAHLKGLLDAAERGHVATVRREKSLAAVVDVARLRHFLSLTCAPQPQVVAEAEGWSAFIRG